jgi:hypothetical protein
VIDSDPGLEWFSVEVQSDTEAICFSPLHKKLHSILLVRAAGILSVQTSKLHIIRQPAINSVQYSNDHLVISGSSLTPWDMSEIVCLFTFADLEV